MKKQLSIFILISVFSANAIAQVITLTPLSSGFISPVCIQNSGLPNDNRLFIIERAGRIRIMNRITGAVNPAPFLDIVTLVESGYGEQGLLGLAFDPDYANNGYFYIDYTGHGGTGNTVISRLHVSPFPDTAQLSSEQIMMTIYQPNLNHNGGNLMFGWDGNLYISMGDGGNGGDQGTGHNANYGNAQHIDSLLGKLLRINVRNPNAPYYFSPSSNPFYGGNAPASTPYAGILPGRNEIFAWGLRNPWRCSIDRMTGDKWLADVGQGTYEEIDYESRCDSAGNNYGWRCYEGNANYTTTNCQAISNYKAPIYTYTHASNNCSVTGGYVYRGGREGAMFGKYFFADYCSGRIWATQTNGTGGWTTSVVTQTNSLLANNISTFGEDIYGELYVAGNSNGNIYKIIDTACAPTAYINAPDTMVICSTSPITFNAIYGTGLTYAWYVDGVVVLNGAANSLSYSLPSGEHSVWVVVTGTCQGTSNVIHVFSDATFNGLNSLYCINAGVDTLTGIPAGGTFSGAGITGNLFDANAAGAGTHTIIYTYTDNISTCNHTASGCVLIDSQTVVVDLCLGIEEQNNIHGVSVYPNPNHSEFKVEFSLLQNSDITMTATDALGRIIYEKKVEGKRGKQNIPVNLFSVSGGVYFLFLKTKSSTSISKVIVQR